VEQLDIMLNPQHEGKLQHTSCVLCNGQLLVMNERVLLASFNGGLSGTRTAQCWKAVRVCAKTKSVLSAKLVSVSAISARVPGSNHTIDGYFSTSLKAL